MIPFVNPTDDDKAARTIVELVITARMLAAEDGYTLACLNGDAQLGYLERATAACPVCRGEGEHKVGCPRMDVPA